MGRYVNIVVEPPGPNARTIVAEDSRYVATTTKAMPVAAASAKGGVVTDVDGNSLIDFACGVAVTSLGHGHPRIVRAVQRQAETMFHFAGTDFYYQAQVDLARRLGDVTPGDHDKKVFFSNSGTECVEAAMKIARWNTGRKQYLSFIGSFHGRTLGSLSLTASKPIQQERFFPTTPGVVHVPFANCYRCPYGHEPKTCGTRCAKVIEEVYFSTFLPPEEVAAMFIEPIQGEGGYIVPPMRFLQEVASICRRHGILLVDDEVQAGMGRTGRMWAIEHAGVVPDILCTAKALGSGVPIGATVFPRRMDMSAGAHSNTFGGNLLACAAALEVLAVIEEERLVERAAKLGEHMAKRLKELQQEHEPIGDVRGLGLMQALELVKDRDTKEHDVGLRDRVVERCYKRGLIVLPAGRSAIRLIPPLIVDQDFLDEGVDILDKAVHEAMRP